MLILGDQKVSFWYDGYMVQDKYFWLGLMAVIVNLIGYVPYIKGILKGTVKPQRITWGIWTILTSITFVNQISNGGGYSTFFFGSTALLVMIVFLLSIRRGMGGRSTFDLIVLATSIALFLLWATTKDTRLTTIIAVTIDCIATLPTLYKTYMKPETEVYLQWMLAAVAGLFSMFAVGGSSDYILYIYPLYIVLMNSLIVGAKYLGTQSAAKKSLLF
jgi:hypothetical protein